MSPSGIDVLLAGINALDEEEREELFSRFREEQLLRQAAEETENGRVLRSLLRVAEVVGTRDLSPEDYRDVWRDLKAAGEDVIYLNAVIKHYGSWRHAKEAIALAPFNSAEKIDARFRARRLGKIQRFSDETLREWLHRCADAVGHPPLVVEFELWRQKELEHARALGDEELRIPSDSPYRRRWGNWENVLLSNGFDEAAVKARLEPGRERKAEVGRKTLERYYTDTSVRRNSRSS